LLRREAETRTIERQSQKYELERGKEKNPTRRNEVVVRIEYSQQQCGRDGRGSEERKRTGPARHGE
jgi:hypothetical protein